MQVPLSFELVAAVPRRIDPVAAAKDLTSVHQTSVFQQLLWKVKKQASVKVSIIARFSGVFFVPVANPEIFIASKKNHFKKQYSNMM
jgi:hypothetical protein